MADSLSRLDRARHRVQQLPVAVRTELLHQLRSRPALFNRVQGRLPDRLRPRAPRIATLEVRPIHLPRSGRRVLRLRNDDHRTRARARRAARVLVPSAWLADADRSRALIELAATGAPLELDGATPSDPKLGPLLTAAIEQSGALDDRKLRSVVVRRAALRDHTEAGADATVSVLLATNRPDDLDGALAHVDRQRNVDIQLVVGLHGEAWPYDTEARIVDAVDLPVTISRHHSSAPLGSVLSSLSERADAPLLTKWDDDDWYGQEHLADLVLAHRYGGAEVTGKFAEWVYLEHSDLTIRRSANGAESYGGSLAGGTILFDADWLDEIGGWQPAHRNVDHLFFEATRARGGTTYRTHGFQYVLRRRAATGSHTWWAPDDYFLMSATSVHCGLRLDLADISIP